MEGAAASTGTPARMRDRPTSSPSSPLILGPPLEPTRPALRSTASSERSARTPPARRGGSGRPRTPPARRPAARRSRSSRTAARTHGGRSPEPPPARDRRGYDDTIGRFLGGGGEVGPGFGRASALHAASGAVGASRAAFRPRRALTLASARRW